MKQFLGIIILPVLILTLFQVYAFGPWCNKASCRTQIVITVLFSSAILLGIAEIAMRKQDSFILKLLDSWILLWQ